MEATVLSQAHEIYDFLNSTKGDSDNPLGNFIEGGSDVFNRIYRVFENKGTKGLEDPVEVISDAWTLAFSLGYVIGNMADITDPGVLRDINAMKKVIREKGILPYMPRERRI